MSAEIKTGKASIAAVKALAATFGVEVAAWNDRVGREFVTVNGDGDKLRLFQKQMEKEGWYAWPVAEDMEGFSMDFATRPPSDDATRQQAASTSPIPYVGTDFRYSGISANFASGVVAATAFGVIVALVLVQIAFPGLSHQALGPIIVATAVVATAITSALDWLIVAADRSTLTIRKPLLRRSLEIPVSEIEKAKPYLDQSTRPSLFRTGYLVVQLKSGKAYNFYLPKRARGELATFLTSAAR